MKDIMRTRHLWSILTLGLLVACAGGRRDAEVARGPGQGGAGGNVIATDGEEPGGEDPEWGIVGGADPAYPSVVQKVVGMINDSEIQNAVQRRGLNLVNVMWEDTGRAEGSSLGPNISDVTLQVRYRDGGAGQETSALMPVIRFPNFSDRTGDVPADKFFVRVGNHKNKKKLDTVPLTDVLRDLKKFASKPWSIQGSGNMLAPRDTHFLVSAQAVFLPIPKKGKAEFNPAVFNYQSAPGSPAVLTLLVTRQGTSMKVIENRPEESASQGIGQELYFNNEGMRSAFTAERKSDVEKRIKDQGGPKTQDDRSALAKGADVLFLIQIPLKHRHRGRLGGAFADGDAEMAAPSAAAGAGAPAKKAASAPMEEGAKDKSDVEQAVLGHGKVRGPFEEGGNLRLERDPQFPIRITVQFYKATSNGVADEKDLDAIAKSIGSVYEHAEFVGSLVLPEGDRRRPTSWQKIPREWFPW
ncbi:MAG: hypothetical protein DYH12_10980 [Sorangiineae bacterium PRO1]|nr:hypothetical protein [Sorangiineae bacterium PRO1]